MEQQQYSFHFEVYESIDQLAPEDALLLREAQEAVKISYAPYSRFYVGAAARLSNGSILKGSNQENASYPVAICAERVLLSAISSVHPGIPVHTMAISYDGDAVSSNRPISPCGMCRQALVEYETASKQPMRLILGGMTGKVFVIPHTGLLLPLGFSGDDLK